MLHCSAPCKTVTRSGRLRDRYVALTDSNLWIVNTARLTDGADDAYEPKCVPVFLIEAVEVPVSPETTFHVRTLRRVLSGRQHFFVYCAES